MIGAAGRYIDMTLHELLHRNFGIDGAEILGEQTL
jgi:hypothetical protein